MAHRSSRRARPIAALILGAIGMASLGVQPQLAQIFIARGLSAGAAGLLATIEIAAMAAGSFAAMRSAAEATKAQVRMGVAVAAIALLLGNLASLAGGADVAALAIARMATGLGEGALAAAAMAVVIASPNPVRMSAVSLALTAIPQLALNWGMPMLAAGGLGANGVFVALAGLALPALALAVRVDPVRTRSVGRAGTSGVPRLALLGVLCATGSACWTFLGELGVVIGLGDGTIAAMLAWSLSAQVVAGLLLAVVAPERGVARLLAATMAVEAIGSAALTQAHHAPMLVALAVVQGLTWQMTLPLGTGLVVARDASPATAALILPVSLFGLAVGPLAVTIVAGDVIRLFQLVAAVLLAGAVAILARSMATGRRAGQR